jgi:hypothetical protein
MARIKQVLSERRHAALEAADILRSQAKAERAQAQTHSETSALGKGLLGTADSTSSGIDRRRA